MVMPPEIPERRAGLHQPVRRQDTVVQRHRVGRASAREVGWRERGGRRQVDRTPCDPVIGLFQTGIDDRGLVAVRHNRRASCRESVCVYLWISGVTEYIKQ